MIICVINSWRLVSVLYLPYEYIHVVFNTYMYLSCVCSVVALKSVKVHVDIVQLYMYTCMVNEEVHI